MICVEDVGKRPLQRQPAKAPQDDNLRATIVVEHIIQASDVAHTIQHWHIYRKWNERLFHEMRAAYRAGRMKADPAQFWYEGECKFFDNYIIPLAKKLKDSNVFCASSDQCLNYAQQKPDASGRHEDKKSLLIWLPKRRLLIAWNKGILGRFRQCMAKTTQ